MNAFKICLLVPFLDSGDNCRYKRDYFTDYNEAEVTVFDEFKTTSHFNFSYDEHITFKKNAEISFSFKMDKYYNDGSDFLLNPYIENLNIGNLIEYTDSFGIIYRFAIKKTQLSFLPHNIVYTFDCQDAFSYQYTRQHNGYALINDASSASFIGPKTIDEWVTQYIIPQCKIGFQYIPLQDGLYKTINGDNRILHYKDEGFWIAKTKDKNIVSNKKYYDGVNSEPFVAQLENGSLTFTNNPSNEGQKELNIPIGVDYYNEMSTLKFPKNPYEVISGDYDENLDCFKPNDIRFYIKKPLLKRDFQFLFEPFVFSCDNSSAGNALVSLSQEKGLILEVDYETETFWFSEEKKSSNSGLCYSPKNQLQDLSFSLNGDSLNSVINIEGPTIGENIITLLPEVPLFWQQFFLSEEWKKTIYCDNLYSQINKGVRRHISWKGELPCQESEGEYYCYNLFTYSIPTENLHVSEDSVIKIKNGKVLAKQDLSEDNEVIKIEFSKTNGNIIEFILKIKKDWVGEGLDSNLNLLDTSYLILQSSYKELSEDEEEFAKIADRIPYLENRIVRFDYLRKIYPPDIFNHLQDLLLNKIRIINGQILAYQQRYFTKLQQKTRIISEIVNNSDILMANIYDNFLDWKTEPENNKFWNGLRSLVGIPYYNYTTITEKYEQFSNDLLDRNKILSEKTINFSTYFTNMLKSLYNFRKYWDWEKTPEQSNGAFWCAKKDSTLLNDKDREDLYLIQDALQQYWYDFSNYANLCGFTVPETFVKNSKYIIYNDRGELNSQILPEVEISRGEDITYRYNENYTTKEEELEEWMTLLDSNDKKHFERISINSNYEKTIYNLKSGYESTLFWTSHINELQFTNITTIFLGPEILYTFKIIKNYFSSYDDSFRQKLLEEKDFLWRQIYKDCNVLLLESNFTSSVAYNSESLLSEALNYYKDYEKPQVQFSLTVFQFDQANSPLRIGDQISLNVEDLYKEYSIIKEALENKLFITEISYNLRKKDSINLSIQTVSYQDRLLSKLIKLIK